MLISQSTLVEKITIHPFGERKTEASLIAVRHNFDETEARREREREENRQ